MPKYQCTDCDGNPTTTQRVSWFDSKKRLSKAFAKHILLACVNSTIADVSTKERVGYETIMGMIDREIAKEVDWKGIGKLEGLGIDEISLKKGHKDFVVIVTGRLAGEMTILGVLQDRTKAIVKEFFLSIPRRLRSNGSLISYSFFCVDYV